MTTTITWSLIDSTRKPGSGTVRVFDSELPGFGVDIGKTKVTFLVRQAVDTFLDERAKSGKTLKPSTVDDMRLRFDTHLRDLRTVG